MIGVNRDWITYTTYIRTFYTYFMYIFSYGKNRQLRINFSIKYVDL